MAAADDILKNFNFFIDQIGYAGNIDEINPPKCTIKTEEYRAGGMDAGVELDMGMEKLEASGTLSKIDDTVLKYFAKQGVNFTARGAVQSFGGTVTAVEVKMTGMIKENDPGTWKAGDKGGLKFTIALTYYKYTKGGAVLHEIDIPNMKRIIGGTDQLAEQRKALGL